MSYLLEDMEKWARYGEGRDGKKHLLDSHLATELSLHEGKLKDAVFGKTKKSLYGGTVEKGENRFDQMMAAFDDMDNEEVKEIYGLDDKTAKKRYRVAAAKAAARPALTAAGLGGAAYLTHKGLKKQAEQEKMASTIRYDDKGNPMVSMYDEGSIPYIDRYEKNKRTIKRVGPGIAITGLGVGLDSLKEKFPDSAAKNIPEKLTDGLMLGGIGLTAAGGAYNYIKERNRNKRIAAAEQEKTAESIPARYKKIDWDNDPTGEKKKIKRKLLASGALTAAGLGVNLSQLALATRDMVKNTNHAKPGNNMVGLFGGGAGLILAEKQLQKAEKLEGLPVGGIPNQKKSRLDDLNIIIY